MLNQRQFDHLQRLAHEGQLIHSLEEYSQNGKLTPEAALAVLFGADRDRLIRDPSIHRDDQTALERANEALSGCCEDGCYDNLLPYIEDTPIRSGFQQILDTLKPRVMQ